MFRRVGMAGLGLFLASGALVVACGGDEREFGSAGPGAGGGEGGLTSGPSDAGDSGSGDTAAGAAAPDEPTDGGGGKDGSDGVPNAGAGGMTPEPSSACPDGYSTWLSSSFSFPDGDVIGATDFPPMPWAQAGMLKIETGRLSGTGTAIVSQGAVFPYAGSRVRFRARFTDSKQQITAGFAAAKDGTGGLRISVDAAGSLTVTEGETAVATGEMPPLESGVDWFVEATFKDSSARVLLSRGNYASENGATLTKALSTDALKVVAAGTKTVAALASSGGTSPSIDEISFSRCGVEPPDLTPILVDTFERADSTALGNADFPANLPWTAVPIDPQYDPEVKIVDGGLQVSGLSSARLPLPTVPVHGLRVRTTIRADEDYLWADVNYNGGSSIKDITKYPGFWVWNAQDSVFTAIFGGLRNETKHSDTILNAGTSYFVELDRDDAIAILTIRKTSFSGEVVLVFPQTGLSEAQNAGEFFWLGTESGVQTTFFEDVRIDQYEVP
jgi:hypothetical protein